MKSLTKSEEKTYFDNVAGVFDTRFNVYSKPSGIIRVERRTKLFIANCGLKPGLRILEVGCGTGEYSSALSCQGLELFATDLSLEMLKEAKKKKQGTKSTVFFVSDIEALPFPDNSFDIILGNSVLHHINTKKGLQEIFRVLKNGARFAFSEPNMLNPQIFLQKRIKIIKRLMGDTPDETAFYRWRLKLMCEDVGFRNMVVRPFDFVHPYTPTPLLGIINKVGMFLEKTWFKEFSGSLFMTGEK